MIRKQVACPVESASIDKRAALGAAVSTSATQTPSSSKVTALMTWKEHSEGSWWAFILMVKTLKKMKMC